MFSHLNSFSFIIQELQNRIILSWAQWLLSVFPAFERKTKERGILSFPWPHSQLWVNLSYMRLYFKNKTIVLNQNQFQRAKKKVASATKFYKSEIQERGVVKTQFFNTLKQTNKQKQKPNIQCPFAFLFLKILFSSLYDWVVFLVSIEVLFI